MSRKTVTKKPREAWCVFLPSGRILAFATRRDLVVNGWTQQQYVEWCVHVREVVSPRRPKKGGKTK